MHDLHVLLDTENQMGRRGSSPSKALTLLPRRQNLYGLYVRLDTEHQTGQVIAYPGSKFPACRHEMHELYVLLDTEHQAE